MMVIWLVGNSILPSAQQQYHKEEEQKEGAGAPVFLGKDKNNDGAQIASKVVQYNYEDGPSGWHPCPFNNDDDDSFDYDDDGDDYGMMMMMMV